MAETTGSKTQDRGGAAPNQWAVLGGVRFLLASIVMFSHFQQHVDDKEPLYHLQDLGSLAAVIAFFIISGYSIANSIDHKPDQYFARRFRRIYPLYFAVWILGVVLCLAGASWPRGAIPHSSAVQLIGCAFLLQGFAVRVADVNSPLWSLSIEAFYYALAPLFKKTPVKLLCLIIAASGFLYWTGIHIRGGFYARQVYGLSAGAFMWSWLLGFVFYFTAEKLVAQMALLILPVFLICRNNELGGQYAPFTLEAVALLMINARRIMLTPRMGRILNYLGDLSYPLYLVHMPMIACTWMIFGTSNTLVHILMAVAGAAALYHGIDKPLRHPKH